MEGVVEHGKDRTGQFWEILMVTSHAFIIMHIMGIAKTRAICKQNTPKL